MQINIVVGNIEMLILSLLFKKNTKVKNNDNKRNKKIRTEQLQTYFFSTKKYFQYK